MYDYGNTDARVPIILSNVTTQTIKIPPRVTIAEIQPVSNETSKDEGMRMNHYRVLIHYTSAQTICLKSSTMNSENF